MQVFLKLNFEEPQEYFFNGFVNNEESNDIDLSVKELNEKYGAGTLDPQTGEFKPAQS